MSGRGRGRERSSRGRGRGNGRNSYSRDNPSTENPDHGQDSPLNDPMRGNSRIDTNLRRAIMSTKDGFVVSLYVLFLTLLSDTFIGTYSKC